MAAGVYILLFSYTIAKKYIQPDLFPHHAHTPSRDAVQSGEQRIERAQNNVNISTVCIDAGFGKRNFWGGIAPDSPEYYRAVLFR